VLKVDAQHALAHHQLGVLEAQQQRMDSAILHLESAVQAAPDNEQYWVSYMDALLMAGSPQQALEALALGVQFGVTPAMAEQLQAEFEQHLELSQPPNTHVNTHENAFTQAKTTPPVGTICTLIPGYKPDYLEPLLLSLATQTYRQFKVIISDDNPNDEVTNTVKQLHLKGLLKGLAIEVVRGPKKGGFANIYHLVRTYAHQAEFFHILMDDDLIYPTFYETHMREHAMRHANVSISARWNANEAGQPCAMTMDAATSYMFTQQFDAQAMASALIPSCNNKLGEWSHAVFRQEAASLILQPSINGMSYFGLDDIGSFIHAAIAFPAIWIPTPLGIFRTNPHQNTGKLSNDTIKSAHYSWIALALIAEQRGWITAGQAWQGIELITQTIRARYAQDPLGKAMLAVLNRYQALDSTLAPAFLAVWNHYLDDIHLAQVLAGDLSIKLL
jgi:tetratricopeptide (TPR) repeat protein